MTSAGLGGHRTLDLLGGMAKRELSLTPPTQGLSTPPGGDWRSLFLPDGSGQQLRNHESGSKKRAGCDMQPALISSESCSQLKTSRPYDPSGYEPVGSAIEEQQASNTELVTVTDCRQPD